MIRICIDMVRINKVDVNKIVMRIDEVNMNKILIVVNRKLTVVSILSMTMKTL